MKFNKLTSANDINEVSSLTFDLLETIKQYSHIHYVQEVAEIKAIIERLDNRASKVIDEFYRTH